MGLKYWWLGLLLLCGILGIVAWRCWHRPRRRPTPQDGLWLANTAPIRRLPRYRELVARQQRWLRLELAFVILAVLAGLLLASRPISVSDDSVEMRSRDIMLCLDVSGSMEAADRIILDSYLSLVEQLKGERIGLVVWNASAALSFPLTDDYEYITENLERLRTSLNSNSADEQVQALLAATMQGSRGSSLIGDGLMSCLLRFDQRAEVRPRTVVLATDNEPAGDPFFTLAEAGQLAVQDRVLVMAVMPRFVNQDENQRRSAYTARGELEQAVTPTGGTVLEVSGADPAVEARIVELVQRQQRQAITMLSPSRSFDDPLPGVLLLAAGMTGMLVTAAGRRR